MAKAEPMPAMDSQPKKMAEGGLVDEIEDEHYNSIAAAIMAKKERQAKLMSDSEEDNALMLAEGGMVDIDENAEEQPNVFYKRNKAILKENYDSDMDDTIQPEDSNLMSDPAEMARENLLDRVGKIRAKMNVQKQFKK